MSHAFRFVSFLLIAILLSYGLYYTAERITTVALPAAGEAPELYSNQSHDDLTKLYLQSIESAKKSILLLIYNLSDPSITHALREKAEEGVEVTVIIDGKASGRIKKYLGDKVRVYQKYDNGLMHLKILVIDEDLVILGSANLSRHSLRIHGNLVMGLASPEIASFVRERAKQVALGTPEKTDTSKVFIIGNQLVEFWFLPSDQAAVNRIISLIEQAKKSLKIAMYTWTRRDFSEAIVRASLRGLKVEAVIDRDSSKSSSKKIANYLQREKIPLFINTNAGLLHHKFMLIDDSIMVNGSANWTKAAFTQNNDCFVVLENLTDEQIALLHNMWRSIKADAKPYTLR